MVSRKTINASVTPKGSLETLSQREVQQLRATGSGSVYALFRQCALAILNTGSHSDNAKTILEAYPDFEISILQQDRGIRLELFNAPADAFVDGEMIASTREMLFSALRDIVAAPKASPTRSSTSCATPASCNRSITRTWWCAGADIRSAARNTTTPSGSATNWGCAAWTCAPAAVRGR
jgi:hypothetical protein